jgi:pyruvate dehydrogenase E2 component (dihydrolipoamide acetyltransferase)
MIPITLPDAAWEGAQDGIEALLDKWLVAPGVPVRKGQVLATVVLVKAAIDVEAPEDGHITAIAVQDGDSFGAGTVLAHFEAA